MASQLKVDTITGVTTAGSIAVTGEGNSTTTNLQQGLGKSWWILTGGNATVSDSFNTASATDNGTGDFQTTRTNNMNSTHYSAVGACGRAGFSYVGGDCEIPSNAFPTTALIKFYTYNFDASLGDVQYISGQLDGDLA
tara:strand:+ start:363 stop:776 length:414 start_codon:yes stop_codon:yes gene_type:complete